MEYKNKSRCSSVDFFSFFRRGGNASGFKYSLDSNGRFDGFVFTLTHLTLSRGFIVDSYPNEFYGGFYYFPLLFLFIFILIYFFYRRRSVGGVFFREGARAPKRDVT